MHLTAPLHVGDCPPDRRPVPSSTLRRKTVSKVTCRCRCRCRS